MRRPAGLLCAIAIAVTACSSQAKSPADAGRAPTWQATVRGVGSGTGTGKAIAAGDVVIADIDRTVVALDRATGRERWRHGPAQGTLSRAVRVAASSGTGGIVTVQNEVGDTERLDVLDLATGRALWHHEVDSTFGDVTVLRDAVYTADCPARHTNACPLTRRHPRTGKPQWTVKVGYLGNIEEPDLGPAGAGGLQAADPGRYLMLFTAPKGLGQTRRLTAIDPRSGRSLGSTEHGAWPTMATDRTLVAVDGPTDENEHDPACGYTMHAVDARDGDRLWRGEISTHVRPKTDGPGCYALTSPDGAEHGTLGLPPHTIFATTADRRPQAFDLDTGRTRWAGSRQGVPIDAGPGVVLVRDGAESGPITAMDPKTGRELWHSPDPKVKRPHTAVIPDAVLVDLNGKGLSVLDPAAGKRLWSARGSGLGGAGDGWFVTFGGSVGDPQLLFYALR